MKTQEILQKFENFINDTLHVERNFHPHYESALRYIMSEAKGKRFRPLLLLHVVNCCKPELFKKALYAAFSIECIHTYSLIHDDLPSMDDSPLRRGNATLHVKHDEATAILVGDALNTYAFEVLANAPLSEHTKIELIKTLSKSAGLNGMVLGQAIDCHFENIALHVEQIKALHVNKTGKLIASALLMGAIIANLEKNQQSKIYNFGLKLGLLFQIQDDIIDATCSEESAGKPVDNDGAKNSFVNILGLDEATRHKEELLKELQNGLHVIDRRLHVMLNELIQKFIKKD